jgi:hypothetical protein
MKTQQDAPHKDKKVSLQIILTPLIHNHLVNLAGHYMT